MLDPEYLSDSQKCGDILLQLGVGLGNRPGTEVSTLETRWSWLTCPQGHVELMESLDKHRHQEIWD